MLPILFEDNDIIALDKPEGLASIPEADLSKDSAFSLASAYAKQKIYPVHRLDKEVSGVIIFAKNAQAHKFLNEQFSKKTVQKIYLALAHGVVVKDSGIIEKPIREYGSGRMGVDNQRGKNSFTKFEVVKRGKDFTLMKVFPLTGRKHQIRVHLYNIGHPIAGDKRYKDKPLQDRFTRLMLHAHKISFTLPAGEKKEIEAPLPESFRKSLPFKAFSSCPSQS
ncbi:MAG: RluA family pseudouridine synthase [Candidatus Omnitrophota bacterium]